MLHSIASDKPKQWDIKQPQAEFAYNNMVDRNTGFTIFSCLY